MAALRRKLRALDYHTASGFDASSQQDVRALVVWLEDQKIRHYKMDERGDLRDTTGSIWKASFKKYICDIACPFDVDRELTSVLDWLLAFALRYEYDDALAQHPTELKCGVPAQSSEAVAAPLSLTPSDSGSPLDIDPSNETFTSAVQALAKILQITSHPDSAVLLEAVRIIIEEKLSEEAVENVSSGQKSKVSKKKQFRVSAKDCGFDLGDPTLEEAAKVLRLLHIQELRLLQTDINGLIVAVQRITANPKTDQTLGQVGR